MKLTNKNYYTLKNKYLSNSKMGDYIKDPEYFYKKNVTGEIEKEVTTSMQKGKAVDMYLTESYQKFYANYTYAVLKRDDPERFEENKTSTKTVLPRAVYDSVIGMCEALKKTSAYKDLKDYKKQQILTMDVPDFKQFDGLCGIPDFFKIEKNGNATIVDLKTCKTIDPRKYFYHCLDYRYFHQMGMYALLLAANFKDTKEFTYKHLVVENTFPYRTRTFVLDSSIVDLAATQILQLAIKIDSTKKFEREDTTWDQAILLTNRKEVPNEKNKKV